MASRAWSPNAQIQSTKAVNGAAPGSNSKSPNLRSSLSAVIHCLREAANTSDPCLLATTVRRIHVRRQSRERLFRETPGEHRRTVAKAQALYLPVYQLAREITRQMGPWDYSGGHATLP